MNEQKNTFTLKQKIFYIISVLAVIFVSCCAVFNIYSRDYQTKQNENIKINNSNTNNIKNIDIKSLNQDSNNVIPLFNVENYSTGFLFFNGAENPTLYANGDSVIIVAFSLEVNANIKYKFDKFYIDTLEYSFTSKFSWSIPVHQLMDYEYHYGREVNKKGTFSLSGNATSVNELCLLENINYFIFESNVYEQTGSFFDDNGIVFSNKLSFNDINGGWNINEFITTPVNGFYDSNKFFTNGDLLKIIHQPSIKSYINGTKQVITSNSDKTYQNGYDKGYKEGKEETLENLPVIDKTAYATTFIWSTITNAVNSVFNVFNIEILPGIPLFALIAIPIVISVLFFVLKVVKK